MIRFVEYTPVPHAPRIPCARAVCIRNARTGIIEVTVARSVVNPRGIISYEEAGTLVWPIDAFIEVHEEFREAVPIVLAKILQ